MTRFGLLIDMSRCNGCYGCFMACRDEFCGNDHLPYSAAQPYSGHFWMRLVERERGVLPQGEDLLLQDPLHALRRRALRRASIPDKVYQRPDGIVHHRPGQGQGSQGDPRFLPLQRDLLERGDERSAEVHPVRPPARPGLEGAAVRRGVPQRRRCCSATSTIRRARCRSVWPRRTAEVLHPEYGLKGGVWYLNLPKRFVAGSLVFGDTDRCAGESLVTLAGGGEREAGDEQRLR